jgi:hypothetical protein
VELSLASLCAEDPEEKDALLLEESVLLLNGLRSVNPAAFSCAGTRPPPPASPARQHGEAMWVFDAGPEGEAAEAAVILRQGQWRLDLFHTDEAIVPPADRDEEDE